MLNVLSKCGVRAALLSVVCMVLSGYSGTVTAESVVATNEQPSLAATYLFDRPHLGEITKPAVLRYKFARKSELDDGFEDTIDVSINAIGKGGRRDTSMVFFTGTRQRPYPDLTDFLGNPIVIMFLQRDVWELSRTRGGQARYFRYRIRQALREAATVEPMTIQTAAGPVDAQRISIKPYENDRYRRRLDEFEFKTYEFVVSADVPGEIYMIRTVVPAAASKGADAPALVEETAVFDQTLEHSNGDVE